MPGKPLAGEEVEPIERLYSAHELARLTGLSISQLRRWHRTGLLPAQRARQGGVRYSFRDLVTARTAAGLLARGVRPTEVRRAVAALRHWKPEVGDPLAALRVFSENGRLLVRVDGTFMEPVSGQLLLDLDLGEVYAEARSLEARVVAVESPASPGGHWLSGAAHWFEAALAAEARADRSAAERNYRKVLAVDPEHAGALLNLGNLQFQSGGLRAALELYERAAEAAPDLPEAHYNLANVLDDLGQVDAAVSAYARTLAIAPTFKAAHFNLALLWEKHADRHRARPHWERYLSLESEGESADIARSFLFDPAP
jgi:tetratricopeptide (TPR) repeat protein